MGNNSSHSAVLLDQNMKTSGEIVEFAAHPFEEGGCRYAFKGRLKGKGIRDGQEVVVKYWKKAALYGEASIQLYPQDLKVSF